MAKKGFGFKPKENGGMIRGPGTGTSDSIATEMQPGTYIMPADSTRTIGDEALKKMADAKVPVRVSNGEFEFTPEQVQSVGAAVLTALRDATHKPVDKPAGQPRGFASGGMLTGRIGYNAGLRDPFAQAADDAARASLIGSQRARLARASYDNGAPAGNNGGAFAPLSSNFRKAGTSDPVNDMQMSLLQKEFGNQDVSLNNYLSGFGVPAQQKQSRGLAYANGGTIQPRGFQPFKEGGLVQKAMGLFSSRKQQVDDVVNKATGSQQAAPAPAPAPKPQANNPKFDEKRVTANNAAGISFANGGQVEIEQDGSPVHIGSLSPLDSKQIVGRTQTAGPGKKEYNEQYGFGPGTGRGAAPFDFRTGKKNEGYRNGFKGNPSSARGFASGGMVKDEEVVDPQAVALQERYARPGQPQAPAAKRPSGGGGMGVRDDKLAASGMMSNDGTFIPEYQGGKNRMDMYGSTMRGRTGLANGGMVARGFHPQSIQKPQPLKSGGMVKGCKPKGFAGGGEVEWDAVDAAKAAALGTGAAAYGAGKALAPVATGLGYSGAGQMAADIAKTGLQSARKASLPGAPQGALGKAGVVGALADTAYTAANTPTDDYRTRFGMQTNEPSLAGDIGVRALGAASDLGNTMTLGLSGKYYADKQANADKPAATAAEKPSAPPARTPQYATLPSVEGTQNRQPAPKARGFDPAFDRTKMTNAQAAEMNPEGRITVTKNANGTTEFSGNNVRGAVSYNDANGNALPGGGLNGKGFAGFEVAPAGSNVVTGPNGSYAYATSGSGTRTPEKVQQDIAQSKLQTADRAKQLGVDVNGMTTAQAEQYMAHVQAARENARSAQAIAGGSKGAWENFNDMRSHENIAARNFMVSANSTVGGGGRVGRGGDGPADPGNAKKAGSLHGYNAVIDSVAKRAAGEPSLAENQRQFDAQQGLAVRQQDAGERSAELAGREQARQTQRKEGMEDQTFAAASEKARLELAAAQRKAAAFDAYAKATPEARAQVAAQFPDLFPRNEPKNLSDNFMRRKVAVLDEQGRPTGAEREEIVDLRTSRVVNTDGGQAAQPSKFQVGTIYENEKGQRA